MNISYSDVEHATEVAETLRKAYLKIIKLCDITDSGRVYCHNIEIAKSLRHMEYEAREYAIKLSNEREGVPSRG